MFATLSLSLKGPLYASKMLKCWVSKLFLYGVIYDGNRAIPGSSTASDIPVLKGTIQDPDNLKNLKKRWSKYT